MCFTFIGRRIGLGLVALLFALPATAETGPRTAPARIEAALLDGTSYSLADSRSPLTVISIWSPESLASRKCIWELQRFASVYESRGVRTVAISTTHDADELRQFVTKRKLSLPVGMLGENDLGTLNEFAMPVVYVFDGEGKLQATHAGLFSYRSLERLVAPFVRQ
jgi:hypothetical protein